MGTPPIFLLRKTPISVKLAMEGSGTPPIFLLRKTPRNAAGHGKGRV